MNSTLIGWLVLLWLPRAGPEDLGRKAQKVAYKRVQLSLFLRRNQRDFPLLRHFWPSNFMINALHDFIFFLFFKTWFRRCCWPQIWKGKLRQYFTILALKCEVFADIFYFLDLFTLDTSQCLKIHKNVEFEFRRKNSNYVFSDCDFCFFKAKINFLYSTKKVVYMK